MVFRRIRRLNNLGWLNVAEAGLYFSVSQIGLALPASVLLGGWVRNGLAAQDTTADHEKAVRLHGAASVIARRWPFGSRCLQHSIVLLWLLRRRGIGGRLRIGVRTTPELVAHAWVEVADRPVNDTPEHCAEFSVMEAAQAGPAALGKLV